MARTVGLKKSQDVYMYLGTDFGIETELGLYLATDIGIEVELGLPWHNFF